MILDLNLLLNHYDSIVCDLIYKLCTHIIVRIQRPQSDNNWDNRRGWLWCEDHMCSRSVNALLRCSIKRSTLMIRPKRIYFLEHFAIVSSLNLSNLDTTNTD